MEASRVTEHRVNVEMDDDEDDGYYWECSCGRSGSGSGGFLRAEIKSDEHIRDDERRVDTNKPFA